jgi:hypothetical protein
LPPKRRWTSPVRTAPITVMAILIAASRRVVEVEGVVEVVEV